MSASSTLWKFGLAALLATSVSTSAWAWDAEESYAEESSEFLSNSESDVSNEVGAVRSSFGDDGDSNSDSSDGEENDKLPNGDSDDEESTSKPAKVIEDDPVDDSDLYPAKRRSRADDDDDDDGDTGGWLGVGETRQDTVEEEMQREEEARREQELRSWFGESFFNANHVGITAELTLGGYFRQMSLGDLDAKFALGLAASWNLGKIFFNEDMFLNRGLWIQLSWLRPFSASGETGTDSVKISQSQNNISLTAMIGYPLWRVFLYGKIGPSLYVGSLNYDISGSTASWSIARGGLTYGIGAHSMFFVADAIGLSARLELLGQRRSYYNDLQLTLSLGAAF